MREYAYTGKPDTCLWCGRSLHRRGVYEAVRRETAHGFRTDTVKVGANEKGGYAGNGCFCTLGCGYQFGLRQAERGLRFPPRQDKTGE